VMLTFLAVGTSILLHLTQVLTKHKVAGSCSMQDVQSFGRPSCRHKLLYLLLRLSTLSCLNHYKIYFLSCFWFRKFRRRVFKLSVPSPTYTARFLETTLVHWNLQGFQIFALIQAHQCMLPSLLRTRKERAYQDLPSGNQEPNRGHPY
jgi:hypothetical protein